MHQDESAQGFDHRAHVFASCVIRGNGGANCDAAILGDFGSHVADTADINIAMLFRESQFGRKMLTNQIAIQQCYRTSACLQKLNH